MPFKKGQSGNINGRPKGSGNKNKTRLSDFFAELIDENKEQIVTDLKELEPRDRLQLIVKLAEFVEPKKRFVDSKVDVTSLTTDEVDHMVDKILADG